MFVKKSLGHGQCLRHVNLMLSFLLYCITLGLFLPSVAVMAALPFSTVHCQIEKLTEHLIYCEMPPFCKKYVLSDPSEDIILIIVLIDEVFGNEKLSIVLFQMEKKGFFCFTFEIKIQMGGWHLLLCRVIMLLSRRERG